MKPRGRGAGRGAGLGAAMLALVVTGVACQSTPADTTEVTHQAAALTGVRVTTRNYDNQRTGANLAETTLKVSNVNPASFGKLFQVTVDDAVFAQVLYASSVPINGAAHNTFFVATAKNSVWAFDADSGAQLWAWNYQLSGARPGVNSDVGQACGNYQDFAGNIGIVGTPVIDAQTSTMFFVTRTVEGSATRSRLHAIDLTTGFERVAGGGVIIDPSGKDGSQGLTFDPKIHNQRAALTLADGLVYISYAAFCDTGAYHGWVVAHDSTTLGFVKAFVSTATGDKGGIWMGGAGPAVDSAGNLYVTTGNGAFDGSSSIAVPRNLGESVVKLQKRTLTPLTYFTPFNFAALNGADDDFGSAGPTILPGTNFLVNGGKIGKVYLLDTTASNMGRVGASSDGQIPDSFQAVRSDVRSGLVKHLHGSSVAWRSPQGLNLYTWGENDFLRLYRFNSSTNKFNHTPAASGRSLPPFGMPGGMLSLSANGSTAGTGVLWATTPLMGNANNAVTPGIVRAYNAEDLSLLWDSSASFNDSSSLGKFNPPVVANGKVFVASAAGSVSVAGFVSVYGLKSSLPSPVIGGQFVYLRKQFTENPGVCIDVPTSSTANLVQLQSFTCNGTGAQVWQFNDKGGGQFEVRRAGTNLCMDLKGGAATRNNVIQQFSCLDNANQRFMVEARAGGVQLRIPNSNQCVDVFNNSNAPGALMQIFDCGANNDAQIFTPMTPQLRKVNFVGAPIVDNGRVLCIDTPNASPVSGVALQVWGCNFGAAQNWQLNDRFNGTFEVRRNSTNLCMDHDNGSPRRVTQAVCNNSASQTWIWDAINQPPRGSPGKQLRSQDTNLCVDIDNGGDIFRPAGTILQLFPCNGSRAQVFDL
jgi:hypothetical protein